ncbi:MAG TPA: hypothetical protein VLC29_05350 [Rhizomicrobium sp.]|nr:hypothetical protein [Rhizomicrobium sp.]
MFALTDIWNTIQSIVHSADTIQLVLMAVVALGAGFMMMELGSVVSTTVVALIAYAILNFIRAIVLQHADITGLLTADWKAFEVMTGLVIISYAILFGVVIAIVSTVRGLVLG